MHNLNVSSAADQDLNDGYLWYEQQQQDLGHAFLREVFSTLDTISQNPFLFPVKFSQKFRFAKVNRFPYLIVYEIFKEQIIVNAVFHTSRKPSIF